MKAKNYISALMAGALLAGALSLFAFTAEADVTAPDEILFSSSFEATDEQIRVSVSDEGYFAGISKIEISEAVPGEFTDSVLADSVSGSSDYKAEESKIRLFDMNSQTKFLHAGAPTASSPVRVSFALASEQTLRSYALVSANDESKRDPKAWTIYGSNDGENYVALDSRSGQTFSDRYQTKTYQFENETAYRFYRFDITENNGADMTQLADLRLGTGIQAGAQGGDSPMTSVVSSGPTESWSTTGAFDKSKTLMICGKQSARKETYARNLLYSDLAIPVTAATTLSYVHFPALYNSSNYDYEYTSMHAMIDLKFTDGTYLSSLGALNTDGFTMEPNALGEEGSLNFMQWNYLETCIGEVAQGKTIESIYVYFNMASTTSAATFLAYFDDLVIGNKSKIAYEHLSDYINPLRGTNNTTSFSRGLTAPFCDIPNGFNFYTAVTNPGSNMPYQYFDRTISQFSVSHVPSTWVGDYATWQFMANTSLSIDSVTTSSLSPANLASAFSHDNESAKAYYYGVTFDEGSPASGVTVEIAPENHSVYVRMTFPEDAEYVNVVFDCYRAGGALSFSKDGGFTATSQHTNNNSRSMQVSGSFDVEPESTKVVNSKTGIATFPKGTTDVTFKFATSYISKNQANHNLELEIPDGTSFDDVKNRAQKAWDEKCGIFEIEGATFNQLVTFYSCVYRLYSYPNLYSENSGTNDDPKWVYASPYQNGKQMTGKMYVNNGFWDTYRTAWAAYALFTPTLDGELLDGLIAHYKDNGWIPLWIAPGGAESMLGTSSDIIFADAYVKGVSFDYQTAYESMLKNAATVSSDTRNGGRVENATAVFTGYVTNSTNNGFSWTMEDYISDYCISVMAEKLGYSDEAYYYANRSKSYIQMYNSKLGFFMGKNAAGEWSSGSGYNPASWWGDYSETNGWTMSFATVYDGNGLANLYGGKEKFAEKLDAYFDNSLSAMKRVSGGGIHEMVEARELKMGQYQHSNQPSHAIPYMYAYSSTPYKTQAITREVIRRLYLGSAIGQGYCGDEDNGEMSAWYILSSLGLYPMSMGSGEYIITAPLFDKVTLHLESGKDLVIAAKNNSDENVYIQSVTVGGEAYNSLAISHSAIADGCEIVFTLGSEPSAYGTEAYDAGSYSAPSSLTAGDEKASPITDMLTARTRVASDYVTLTSAPKVYSENIDSIKNLFDNTSATTVSVKDQGSMVYSCATPTEIDMITLTSGRTGSRMPSSFTLEASNDGANWVTVTTRDGLSFKWGNYTMPFTIPEESRGAYYMYRLTFGCDSTVQISEIELLGVSRTADELAVIDATLPPDGGNEGGTESDAGPGTLTTVLIIIGSAVIALGAVTVLLIVRKNKQHAA